MAKANYKYFIGFFYNDHKAKPLHIMLPKTSAYVKSYDRQKIDVFLLEDDDDVLKNVLLFGIKLSLIQKNNLIKSI